ncbi:MULTISPECIES: CU044_5270 family protein [unclassified Streptomyces]|uniref:CU044_5270 family protein n=1 Tax=unclassified Streptomyces TaxID=2593676 RepID=UPI000CD509C1|nr:MULTISPECIES: CU044_5270 family protein [unclassified Streptomyces]MCI4044541.1 CU044_5270 family protein [Streptomyces sp. TRM75563]
MDEMTQLRELRADAPIADRAALAPGRERLTDAITGRNRRARRLWSDWRVASLGAAAAITAAALIITQVVDTSSNPDTLADNLDLSGPTVTLNRAADFLEEQKVPPEPRAGQWIYTVDMFRKPKLATVENIAEPDSSPAPSWTPYADPEMEKDPADDAWSARETYRAAESLPDDPAALLAEVRALYPAFDTDRGREENATARTFRGLSTLIESFPLSPAARARIYRALGTVPGVRVTDHLVRDAAGRKAIAVTFEEPGSHERQELLLSPSDYSYAGTRHVVTEDHELKELGFVTRMTAGDITLDRARTAASVVDARGEEPQP